MDYVQRLRRVLAVRCVHLRTKAGYMALPARGEEENPYPTAVWWCGRTLEALGPEGHPAEPGACDGPGRPCYRAPSGSPARGPEARGA